MLHDLRAIETKEPQRAEPTLGELLTQFARTTVPAVEVPLQKAA